MRSLRFFLPLLLLLIVDVIIAAAATELEECRLAAKKPKDEGELLRREDIITVQLYTKAHISHDGSQVGYLARDAAGVYNIFVYRVSDGHARQVTHEEWDVSDYTWIDSGRIMYERDQNGDEIFQVYVVDFSQHEKVTRKHVDLGHYKTRIHKCVKGGKRCLISANNEPPHMFYDYYHYNPDTGELRKVLRNSRFPVCWTDASNDLRICYERLSTGDCTEYRVTGRKSMDGPLNANDSAAWEAVRSLNYVDCTLSLIIGFTKDGKHFYMKDSATDVGNVVLNSFDNVTDSEILLSTRNANYTFGEFNQYLLHPTERRLLAISHQYAYNEWITMDAQTERIFDQFRRHKPDGHISDVELTDDGRLYLILYYFAGRPAEVHLFNATTGTMRFLFNQMPGFAKPLYYHQFSFTFHARDGLPVHAYLQLPLSAVCRLESAGNSTVLPTGVSLVPGRPKLALIVEVHGGPPSRDEGYFDTHTALRTNRGYAILQVNYRGSTGFGRRFFELGNGEWSRAMHTDLIDGVRAVIDAGIVDSKLVVISGTSYGGYSALVGATYTPDFFKCAVSVCGPSNLVHLVQQLPSTWTPLRAHYIKMVGGDIDTEEGMHELIARSPYYRADKVKIPMLIMQGANDPRVVRSQSEEMVEALQRSGIPFTYVVFPNEGHGFVDPKNALASAATEDEFFASCLGGRSQPFEHGQYKSSAEYYNSTTFRRHVSTSSLPSEEPTAVQLDKKNGAASVPPPPPVAAAVSVQSSTRFLVTALVSIFIASRQITSLQVV